MSESRGLVEDSLGRLWSLGGLLDSALPQRRRAGSRCRTTAPGATTSSAIRPAGHGLGQHLRRGDPHRRHLPLLARLHPVPRARHAERHLRHRRGRRPTASPGSARRRGCSSSTRTPAPTSTSPALGGISGDRRQPARGDPGRPRLVRHVRSRRHGPARPGLVRRPERRDLLRAARRRTAVGRAAARADRRPGGARPSPAATSSG